MVKKGDRILFDGAGGCVEDILGSGILLVKMDNGSENLLSEKAIVIDTSKKEEFSKDTDVSKLMEIVRPFIKNQDFYNALAVETLKSNITELHIISGKVTGFVYKESLEEKIIRYKKEASEIATKKALEEFEKENKK